MPQSCSSCRSPQKVSINRALDANEPFESIASRFNVGKSSLQRHSVNCRGQSRRKQRVETSPGDSADTTVTAPERFISVAIETPIDYFSEIEWVYAEIKATLTLAKAQGDLRLRVTGLEKSAVILEKLGKAKGWVQGDGVHVYVDQREIRVQQAVSDADEQTLRLWSELGPFNTDEIDDMRRTVSERRTSSTHAIAISRPSASDVTLSQAIEVSGDNKGGAVG